MMLVRGPEELVCISVLGRLEPGLHPGSRLVSTVRPGPRCVVERGEAVRGTGQRECHQFSGTQWRTKMRLRPEGRSRVVGAQGGWR